MDAPLSQDEIFNQNWMTVSSWILAGISVVFLGLRIFVRLTYPPKKLGWDDWILILAWVLLLVQTVAITVSVKLGLGRHFYHVDSFDNIVMIARLGQVNVVSSILAAVLSKTSFAITLLRLGEKLLAFKVAVWFIIITINLFMNSGIILNYVQCTPVRKVWETWIPGECWPRNIVPTYNAFAAAYSGAADIALAILPWFILVKLQMRLSERIGAAIAMSCGVFAGATAMVKTPKVLTLGNEDPIHDSAPLTVWGNAEIATTIMAASIPVLRVFLRDVMKSISASPLGKCFLKSSSDKSTEMAAIPAPDPGRPRSRRENNVRRPSDLDSVLDEDDDGSQHDIWPKTPNIVLTHEISVQSQSSYAAARAAEDASLDMHG